MLHASEVWLIQTLLAIGGLVVDTTQYEKHLRNIVTRVLSLFVGVIASFTANASDSYNKTFSNTYTALSGYELSEAGLRDALDNIDDIWKNRKPYATIEVIGEQRYTNLADDLKAIYARKTIGPDVGSLTTVNGKDLTLYRLQGCIARALVKFNDPEGERYALEQALRTPSMDVTTAVYALRTLKYLVKENGTYVGAELEFLINAEIGPGEFPHTTDQIRELCEIEKYVKAIDAPETRQYTEIIERLESTGTTKVKRAVRMYKDRRPDWLPTREILDAAGN